MAVELSIFLLLATSPTVIATNSSGAATVGWVSDPAGRGTFSLLFSSLLTLGLCVWSAMHLNIPPHDEQPAQSWMKNFKWGLIGVFAPELIVFAAWRQYNSAKALHAEIQGYLNAENLTPPREDTRDDRSKVNLLKDVGWSYLQAHHPLAPSTTQRIRERRTIIPVDDGSQLLRRNGRVHC